jgi:EAL domain-containing protein (putative c-di-GMP-specific phosphodiesterase class I)
VNPTFKDTNAPNAEPDRPVTRRAARVLLLCQDPAWRAAIEGDVAIAERQRGSYGVVVATSAREAMQHLAVDPENFSHLLLEPVAAGDLLAELLSLTSGEAGPGPALVLLGPGHVPPAVAERLAVTVTSPRDAGWLAPVLQPWAAPARTSPRGMTCAEDLRRSIAEGHARVLYQPVVRFADRRPIGLEALARMEHPLWGRLAPEFFLPGIEAAGLLRQLSRAVIETCLADWDGDRLAELDLRLAINLPLDILVLGCLPDWLDERLTESRVPASRLMLEMTETQLVSDQQELGIAVTNLRARGYQLAIDDVGPTLRDPAQLFALPFNVLKLDKSIVRESADSAEARKFLRQTIGAAHDAGMTVVAEGVEDAEIWARMRSLGVECGQGYAIARPLPAVAVPLWHRGWMADARARPGLADLG